MQNDMFDYVVINPNGSIDRLGSCGLESLPLQAGPGQILLPDPGGISDATHYWTGEAFALCPPKPGPWAVLQDGAWIDPRTAEDIAADQAKREAAHWTALRAERDRLLALCDWTQVADVPLTTNEKQAWRDYREALRDMPETTQDPANPVWPTKPQN